MIVSPNNINVPLIAPSVNMQTEQAARENRVRNPVTPTVQLEKTNAERQIKSDDKRRRNASWDPSEHPEYEVDPDEHHHRGSAHAGEAHDKLERLFELLALSTYSEHQGKGYIVRFRFPWHIIDAAITEGKMAKRRVVIKYHYGYTTAPNIPSEVLAVL